MRPLVYDPIYCIFDYPKRFISFQLHVTKNVKSDSAQFDLSGFRMICFRANEINNLRLDDNLPQYGSDYEFLVRLKKSNPALSFKYDSKCRFIADLKPVGRKVDDRLNFTSLVSSIFDIRSPLNFKYLYRYLKSINLILPLLVIFIIYSRAAVKVIRNKAKAS